MKKKNHVFMFYKGTWTKTKKKNKEKNKEKKQRKTEKMNMIKEHRSVQKDETLDLQGVVCIKKFEYERNSLLKKVIIGSSVQTIEAWAFIGCRNLEEILFEEPCQITKLEQGCFAICSNLKKIDLPSSIEEIDINAFFYCPLERVILRGPCRIEDEF